MDRREVQLSGTQLEALLLEDRGDEKREKEIEGEGVGRREGHPGGTWRHLIGR